MEKLTHGNVQYAVVLACRAAGVTYTLDPRLAAAERMRIDATALAELLEIDDSDAAMLEVLARMEATATLVIEQAGGDKVAVWRLARRHAQVATAFITTYQQQVAAEKAAPGIDDDNDVRDGFLGGAR